MFFDKSKLKQKQLRNKNVAYSMEDARDFQSNTMIILLILSCFVLLMWGEWEGREIEVGPDKFNFLLSTVDLMNKMGEKRRTRSNVSVQYLKKTSN